MICSSLFVVLLISRFLAQIVTVDSGNDDIFKYYFEPMNHAGSFRLQPPETPVTAMIPSCISEQIMFWAQYIWEAQEGEYTIKVQTDEDGTLNIKMCQES